MVAVDYLRFADQPETIRPTRFQKRMLPGIPSAIGSLRSFTCGHAPPQLVKEILQKDYVVLRGLCFERIGRHERDDALAIRGEIIIADTKQVEVRKLLLGLRPRGEGVLGAPQHDRSQNQGENEALHDDDLDRLFCRILRARGHQIHPSQDIVVALVRAQRPELGRTD